METNNAKKNRAGTDPREAVVEALDVLAIISGTLGDRWVVKSQEDVEKIAHALEVEHGLADGLGTGNAEKMERAKKVVEIGRMTWREAAREMLDEFFFGESLAGVRDALTNATMTLAPSAEFLVAKNDDERREAIVGVLKAALAAFEVLGRREVRCAGRYHAAESRRDLDALLQQFEEAFSKLLSLFAKLNPAVAQAAKRIGEDVAAYLEHCRSCSGTPGNASRLDFEDLAQAVRDLFEKPTSRPCRSNPGGVYVPTGEDDLEVAKTIALVYAIAKANKDARGERAEELRRYALASGAEKAAN